MAIATKQVKPGQYKDDINLALQGRKPDGTVVADGLTREGYILEGQIGRFLDNKGVLLRYQEVINSHTRPNGKPVGIGEVDAETPRFLFEVTAKSTPKKVKQLTKRVNNTLINPNRKPVIFYAPNVTAPQQVKVYTNIPGVKLIRSMEELTEFVNRNGGF
ncbi:hypothetical protein [Spartinivicinus poritis]|uniref:Uncharacterized protein n=1 Tax=Spartinivicinus poritis TaxID=2994640 RepID=A0ABT5UIA7_9GAMM|nr:hypothetical protein [Spartinivicinus sp. A2-2]MDE1465721.1 hypothetical protein [Spartinivicinus sp. A2-2]